MLTDAAIAAKIDNLYGLKENVIMGRLIPAGTGLRKYKELLVTSENSNIIEAHDAKEKSQEIKPSKAAKILID